MKLSPRRSLLLIPCAAALFALTAAGCHKDADTSASTDTTAPASAPAAVSPAPTTPPGPSASTGGPAPMVTPGGPGGTMMNKPSTNPNGALGDANITMHVKNALIADKAVKASDINVDTKSETVVLRGSQASKEAITAAATDTKKVTGVKTVINQLTVKAP